MQAIVLFARSPEREAAAKRIVGAAPLFRSVVAAWLEAAHAHGAMPLIACAAEDREALAAIAPHVARGWIEQGRAAFGERVCSATAEAFALGFSSVIVAAIDAPPPSRLGEALATLAAGVPVVGPARDGGINFIGLTTPDRALLGHLTARRCRALLPNAIVFETTTDVDSRTSLDRARHERQWRGYLHAVRVIRTTHVAHALRGTTRSLPPRAPPL